ncbi:hypothetical protein DBR06_SOUSAS30710001, partial [Sousa chinensis]
GQSRISPVQNNDFHWNNFWKETESSRAPFQESGESAVPPANDLKVGLEGSTKSPRFFSRFDCPGAMSQPTLDSSDNRNDLQRLPDSLDTQPVGTYGGKPRCFTSAFPGVPDGCVAGPVFLSGALRI